MFSRPVPGRIDAGFTGVRPDVCRKFWMIVGDSGVDDSDDHAAVSRGDVPGRRGFDVGAGEIPEFIAIVETPLLRELRIIGNHMTADLPIRFHPTYLRQGGQQVPHVIRGAGFTHREGEQPEVRNANAPTYGAAVGFGEGLDLCRCRVPVEGHQQVIRDHRGGFQGAVNALVFDQAQRSPYIHFGDHT